jgi:hypothetical protein
MVKEADAVIAIWDGESKGTRSSIDFAWNEKKLVYIMKIPADKINLKKYSY